MNGLLASLTVGPVQFDVPFWLWLIPIGWAFVVWIGRSSLSGLGTATRRVALVVRLIVIAVLSMALAEPQWRDEAKAVDVTFVIDASRSIPRRWQSETEQYVEMARRANTLPDDQLSVITVGADAYVQSLPSAKNTKVERSFVGADQATNIAGGLRLALSVKGQEAAAKRVVIVSDFNETVGSILEVAEAARAMGVPVDVLPVTYSSEGEVVVEQLIAPTTARMGENVNLKVVLNATRGAVGRLNILLNGDPVDLDPESEGMGDLVRLTPGTNVLAVPITVPRAGPQQFRAIFEPIAEAGRGTSDAIIENNEALATTFVSAEGRTLVLSETTEECDALIKALTAAKISAEVRTADQAPKSLTELNGYDAIILVNQPAYNFSQQQQEDLRQYIHESGGGLVMIGGPDSFGAGGWIGSPLEDALPVKLDPPQKRQMPRGALAVITHSIEMPEGVNWGKKTARAAVEALSRLDLISLIEFDGQKPVKRFPIAEVGDGSAVRRAIENLAFGDMPDYNGPMELALKELESVQAGTKHMVLITDGDASAPTPRLIQMYKRARVTVSTVAVFPHTTQGGDLLKLQRIAEETGGRAYQVLNQAGLGQIVQIFIKEAQTVKRSLIWEGDPFSPAVSGLGVESMRGITSVPPISGYVVAAEREGLAQVTLRGQENDPVAAQWQYGLGRVMAFTSDASTRWDAAWVGWPGYRAFWEQHLRWAMRPSGNANLRVTTEKQGDFTRVIVDATGADGERMNFARFKGRVAGPDGTGQDVELVQVGPGRYEGRVETKQAGSHVMSLRYAAPQVGPDGTTKVVEGSVQAAIERPFADEFRALTDNQPLAQQVAKMTGGRVLDTDPTRADVWRREGLKMPVATTPIWLAFAIAGIAIFLIDVAVRRVRIDLAAMAVAVRSGFKAGKQKTGQQMDALRAARETAKAQIAKRAVEAERGTSVQPPAGTAKVKFEADAARMRKKEAGPELAGEKGPEKPPIQGAPKKEPTKDEGMSRLMKAKKRAQEEMDE